ncbi:MAG TPA: response regulator [Pseudomonas sp.]|uniref:response regulator n=1 Tax=Pseudomonas sp. TaxID=306 RepID=UPI002BB1E724|nr:response regulator [Pseudomonas sp.]HRL94785.1 response regulator [Pseudomonas sp.]
MKLARFSNLLTWLVVGLLATACASVWLAFTLNEEHRAEMKHLHQASDTISRLQLGSHALTLAVRNYVTTTDELYYQAYLDEKNSDRSYDKALEQFLAQQLSSKDVALLLESKKQSLQLEQLQMQAFATARKGDWAQAIELAFGAPYQQTMLAIIEPLEKLEKKLHQEGQARIEVLQQQLGRASVLAISLMLISLLLVLLVLRSFYHRRVLQPLVALTGNTHQLLKGERDIRYANIDEDSEIGDLSRALSRYGEVIRELETERRRFSESDAWYRQIIEFAPDGMLVVDADGLILIANPKAHDQFVYPPGSLIGQSIDLLVPTSIRPQHADMRKRFMAGSGHRAMDRVNGDFRAVDSRGREFPVELGLTRLPLVDGHPACACVMVRDITERKRYEQTIAEQLEFQRVLLDTLPYPVFFKDAEARYLGFNQAFLDVFGVRREELIGKTVLQFLQLPAEERPQYQRANEKILREGGVYTSEMHIPGADGEMHPAIYCLSGYPGSDGKIAGLVGTLIDISTQKAAEQTMAQAKELAEEATRQKSDFLANMSHEIRTPMNVIMGMAHLALDSQLDKRQRNYLEKISSAAQGLLGIINDILDFSKIEAGKLHVEAADFYLEDVLDSLVDLATLKAQEKGLELLFDIATDVPTSLIGDSLRLGQILNNLLSNALKFTERGEITVAISPEGRSADQVWLRFEVSDTGIGLSTEQSGRLFQAFSQADSSTSRKYGGTGLGLTICARLVELMGGEIGVDSELGVGSTFFIRAPFKLQSQQRELLVDGENLLGMPILVVDDNASARGIFHNMLSSLKFEVATASSAAEAIGLLADACAAGRPYRLVLMDWMMPDMDGVEAMRAISSDTRIGETPVFVMVTAYSRDELLERLGNLPVAGVLVKPVTPSTLLDSILNTFGQQALARPRKKELLAEVHDARQALQGAYLLLVEDNQVNQEMTVEILARAGIRVDVASNGAEALSMVAKTAYDGVLMDCQMPVMDGFEATRRIRAQAHFAQLPILAMTANAMAGDKEKCLQAGMNDHIAKPLDVNQLFITLQRWVKAPGARGALPELTSEDTHLPVIAGLQMDAALQRLDGNSALLRKLLKRFCETQADSLERVRAALAVDDRDTAVRAAHSLKGLAGNIGARGLVLNAAELEAQLRHGRDDEAELNLQGLVLELHGLISQIEQGLQATPQPPEAHAGISLAAADVDIAALNAGLERLENLLREDDGEAGECLAAQFAGLLSLGWQTQAEDLERLIGRYQFDQALQLLQALRQRMRLATGSN